MQKINTTVATHIPRAQTVVNQSCPQKEKKKKKRREEEKKKKEKH